MTSFVGTFQGPSIKKIATAVLKLLACGTESVWLNTLKVEVAVWKMDLFMPQPLIGQRKLFGFHCFYLLSRSAKILKDGVFQTVGLNLIVSHAISSRPAYFL